MPAAPLTAWIAGGVVAVAAGFGGGVALGGGGGEGAAKVPTRPQAVTDSASVAIHKLRADPAAPGLKIKKHVHKPNTGGGGGGIQPPVVTQVPTPTATRPPVITPAPTTPPTTTTVIQ